MGKISRGLTQTNTTKQEPYSVLSTFRVHFSSHNNPSLIRKGHVWSVVRKCKSDRSFIIDLRTAQVYWDAIFLVSQEVYLNFHHFCG